MEAHPPARRHGGARRHPLVGPQGGLPHRGARPDEGPEGEERGDRARRFQGRLHPEAGHGHARRAPCGGLDAVRHVHARVARHHRQPRRRRGRAPGGGPHPRRPRPVPGGGGRQGHRHLQRHRERDQRGVRVLARGRVRLGRLARLRPQGAGDHGPRRVGVGEAPLPRGGDRRHGPAVHGGGHRRHVGRRVRQRDALHAADPARLRVRSPARVHRSRRPIPPSRSRSGSGSSRSLGPRGPTTTRRS